MVKIVTDTTACLPQSVALENDIRVIPQVINFGEESFLEGVDIDIKGFMQRLKNSPELPKTAAPPPHLFVQAFQEIVPQGEPILCIHPSSKVSGTVRSATVAAQDFPQADIRIIDTQLVASPMGVLVMLAAQWTREGQTIDDIEREIRRMALNCRIYFLVATLDYLAKGGRIGGATALLGSLLQIKPILTVKDGQVEPFKKERTFKQALRRLKELVLTEYPRNGNGYLTVLHAGVPAQGKALAEDLRSELKIEQVPVYDMPPAIVTHGGPGILGAAFFRDS
jgi:DegV family protein with EDD domain